MVKSKINSSSLLLATILKGAWRDNLAPLACSTEELSRLAPLLLGSGAGALGWRRIRGTELEAMPPALELKDAYRLHRVEAALHRISLSKAFTLLRAHGIEPILIKGWAVARLYTEECMRPSGDIDLCVRPEQYSEAERVLKSPEGRDLWVDLHRGLDDLRDYSLDDLYARSQLVRLDDELIRVLAPEDHLRLLCIHMLRHGAWRPLWLCDIAASFEQRPAGFDWDILLGGDGRRAAWVASAIGLAHRLLEARIEDTPLAASAGKLPAWLVRSVLKEWETPFAIYQSPMRYRAPMAAYLRRPAGALGDLWNRWPSPIVATVSVNGSFNNLPRLPFQLGNCLMRATAFLTHMPQALREN